MGNVQPSYVAGTDEGGEMSRITIAIKFKRPGVCSSAAWLPQVTNFEWVTGKPYLFRRKLHLSNLSDFKTLTCSLHKDKNAVYCFQISLFVPEIFKFLKYANWPSDDVILIKYAIRNVWFFTVRGSTVRLCNMSLQFLLPWQHTGFQASMILKAFVHHRHDPASI